MKKMVMMVACTAIVTAACCNKGVVEKSFDFAEGQLKHALTVLDEMDAATPDSVRAKQGKYPRVLPRSIKDGELFRITPKDWTSGFFPGSLWYMYEFTNDQQWREAAERYTALLEPIQFLTSHHDVGFMINCSYGNGLRLTGNEAYKDIMVQAAKSLCTRYDSTVQSILSWNVNPKRPWKFAVIVDNMMNLELLFKATELSGDSTFYNIAVTHANTTMKNHFRDNNTSYHVVDYDPETGEVIQKNTLQGYAHESAWARGQSWGLYGFTMAYRKTNDPAYLEQAEKIAAVLYDYPNVPEDRVPYWDYDAPNIPNEPRDASAAAIMASALYELSTYNPEKEAHYKAWADKIVESLSKSYRAEKGGDFGFILLHSCGNINSETNPEMDVPLNYADYYFLESLLRKQKLETDGKL